MKHAKKLLFVLLLGSINLLSQTVEPSGGLIQGGIDDGVKMLDAYLLPLNRAIMVGADNTMYNKIAGNDDFRRFSISLQVPLVFIPDVDKTFDVDKLGLKNVEAVDAGNSIAQSVFGDSASTIKLGSTTKVTIPFSGTKRLYTFDSPKGSGLDFIPLPTISAAYHMKYTNLSLGLIPWITIPNSDVRLRLVNANIHQDLAMFFGFLEDMPLAVSVMAGYYQFNAHADLYVRPEGVNVPVTLTGQASGPYDNQVLDVNYSSVYFGGYASLHAGMLTVFGGVGYNTAFSNLKLLGTYPVYSKASAVGVVVTDIDDPIDTHSSYSRLKGDVGVRFDTNHFLIQANYTIAAYGGPGLVIGFKF